jgi:hypothetical protein
MKFSLRCVESLKEFLIPFGVHVISTALKVIIVVFFLNNFVFLVFIVITIFLENMFLEEVLVQLDLFSG